MDEIAQFPVRKSRHKQAAAFERERFKGKNRKTKLAALLLEKWAWGQLNATLLQKVAEAAAEDLKDIFDENIEEWDVLAKCGSSLVFSIKVFIFSTCCSTFLCFSISFKISCQICRQWEKSAEYQTGSTVKATCSFVQHNFDKATSQSCFQERNCYDSNCECASTTAS